MNPCVRARFSALDAPVEVLVNNAGIEHHGMIEELKRSRVR